MFLGLLNMLAGWIIWNCFRLRELPGGGFTEVARFLWQKHRYLLHLAPTSWPNTDLGKSAIFRLELTPPVWIETFSENFGLGKHIASTNSMHLNWYLVSEQLWPWRTRTCSTWLETKLPGLSSRCPVNGITTLGRYLPHQQQTIQSIIIILSE